MNVQKYYMLILIIISINISFVVFSSEKVSYAEYIINKDIKYQVIDNFSASDAWRMAFIGVNWPDSKKNKIADLLFSQKYDLKGNPIGMGLSNWRVNIGGGSYDNREYKKEVESTWNRTECFLSPDGQYDFDKQTGQQWFMSAAKERGMNNFLIFSNSAPYFMTRSASTLSPDMDKINLQDDKFDDFANFLVTCADHFIKKGFNIKYISPINEPNVNWSTNKYQEGSFATKSDIFKIVSELNKAISKKSIDTKIIIPEVGEIKYLFKVDNVEKTPDNIIDDFFTPHGRYKVTDLDNLYNCVAAHDYWTTYPPEVLVESRVKVRLALDNLDSIKFWASEYCILEENEDISGTTAKEKSINLGLYIARIIHCDLAIANASAWQWWTAVSLAEDVPIQLLPLKGSSMETIKYDGIIAPTKMFWATANYSFFIRPGMHRIDIQPANKKSSLLETVTSLMVSSYTDGRSIVTVFVNYKNKEERVNLKCDNFNIGKVYVTSINKNLEYCGEHRLQSLIIPPKSIVTVVI